MGLNHKTIVENWIVSKRNIQTGNACKFKVAYSNCGQFKMAYSNLVNLLQSVNDYAHYLLVKISSYYFSLLYILFNFG